VSTTPTKPNTQRLPTLVGTGRWRKQDYSKVNLPKTIDLQLIERYGAAGLTRWQIATALGVPESKVAYWACSEDWRTAYQKGRGNYVGHVERTLAQRALGYEVAEDELERVKVGRLRRDKRTGEKVVETRTDKHRGTAAEPIYDEEERLVVVRRKIKHVVPDTIAALFILTNRDPDRWKHKNELVTDGQLVKVVELKGLTAEDFRRVRAIIEEERKKRLGDGAVEAVYTTVTHEAEKTTGVTDGGQFKLEGEGQGQEILNLPPGKESTSGENDVLSRQNTLADETGLPPLVPSRAGRTR
jgi:hypothetical protein